MYRTDFWTLEQVCFDLKLTLRFSIRPLQNHKIFFLSPRNIKLIRYINMGRMVKFEVILSFHYVVFV